MITNVKPMSVDHARALAMAFELYRLLGDLNDRPENGKGSSVECAWDLVEQVISYLEPLEGDVPGCGETTGERMARLRLQLTEGRLTQDEYWRAVDAIRPQRVPSGRRAL
jgi:hypothetical protein